MKKFPPAKGLGSSGEDRGPFPARRNPWEEIFEAVKEKLQVAFKSVPVQPPGGVTDPVNVRKIHISPGTTPDPKELIRARRSLSPRMKWEK